MGILVNLIQTIIAKLFGGGSSQLVSIITSMLQNKSGGSGGLASIIAGFQKNGLSHLTDSWVGTGPNADPTTDELKLGLGDEKVTELAKKTGMKEEDLLGKLKQYLPQIVDKLTPGGKLPS